MSDLLTLTSDFGLQDAYVAAMKGVILSINPVARMVDITHEIAPQEIMAAAFVLRESIPYFPAEATHLIVVDPGVGTSRRAVAIRHNDQTFVGADNGLFPLVLGTDEPDVAVELTNHEYWRTAEPSKTFHGRDIFAPVAAHLASGAALHDVGDPISSLTPLRWAMPIVDSEGIQGWTMHIDRFGNCISNIPQTLLKKHRNGRPMKSYVGSEVLDDVHETYGTVPEGDPVALFGSSGFLEIAVNGGNAAELLGIRKGDKVNIVFSEPPA